MAIITCPECGKEISDQAPRCIHCGYYINPEPPVAAIEESNKTTARNVKKPLIILGGGLLLIVVAVSVYFLNFTVSAKYNKANKFFEKGNYEKAVKYYTAVGDYKNAETKLSDATTLYNYYAGITALEEENWAAAKEYFNQCIDYEDSKDLINQADYNYAVSLMTEANYTDAKSVLSNIKQFPGAQQKICECDYYIGCSQQESGDYVAAAKSFKDSSGFDDANERIIKMGEELVEQKDYSSAWAIFSEYPNSKDISANKLARYAEGQTCLSRKDYKNASVAFDAASDYLDSQNLYKESTYNYAKSLFDSRDYDTAKVWFSRISGFKDSDALENGCALLKVKDLIETGNLHSAENELNTLDDSIEYEGYSVAGYKELLANNAKWVNLCGKWTSTGGQMRSTQSGSYYDYWWYRDFEEGNENLDVRCGLNEDDSIKLRIEGTIDVYTSYGSIKELVETGKVDVTIYKDVTSMGTIKKDDYTSLTLSDSKITVNYKKTDKSRDVYFTYIYKTDVTYGKRIEDY